MQTSLVLAVVAFAAAVSAQGKTCKTTCGLEVPHGWAGYGDGYNHCNRCGCTDGWLACTKMACTDKPCPQEVCQGQAACGGYLGLPCKANHVCLDDPADSCDPASGGADCGGCCLFNECTVTKCPSKYTCELNTLGQAECVLGSSPVICCKALPVCPQGFTEVDSCSREEFLSNSCTQVSLCCSTLTCKAL